MSKPASLFLLSLVCFLASCNAVAPQPPGIKAEQQAENFGNQLADGARKRIAEIKRRLPEGPYCDDGTFWFHSNVIYTVQPSAAAAGLRPGDRVTAVNGVRGLNAEESARAVRAIAPGATVILTIDRKGDEMDIKVVCADGSNYRTAYLRILQATADKDWKTCKEAVQSFIVLFRMSPSDILDIGLQCSEAERSAASRRPGLSDAVLRYDTNRKRIEEARYDPTRLAENRGRLLAEVEFIRRMGYPSFAEDLRAELDKPTTRQAGVASLPPIRQTKTQGTCFAVTPDGGVLTAYHIVQNANEIWVTFSTGQRERAQVEQSAMAVDVALLRTNHKVESYLPLASTRSATAGQRVFTVGFPATQVLGFEPKFTDGSISALSGLRGEASLIQITVPIQPGNSGDH